MPAVLGGATNLFFNRDTKVFLGQSGGTVWSITACTGTSSPILTTTAAHGLSNGDRIIFTAVPGGISGYSTNTVYFVVYLSTTTFSLAATYANAVAAVPTRIGITGAYTSGGALFAPDNYITPTGATAIVSTNATQLTITATHTLTTNDYVEITGLPTAYASLNGVYKVASVSTTVSFTVATVGAVGSSTTVYNALTQAGVRINKINMWELPVLAGYSMNQGSATSEITLSEMSNSSGVSRRGRQVFTDAISPTEWSFDTYMRPFKSTNHYCVEEPLWAFLIGKTYSSISGTDTSAVTTWTNGVTRDSTDLEFSFSGSNTVTLSTFNIYFVLGASKVSGRDYAGGTTDAGSTTIYRLADSVVNECAMSFDIDGIATISWSGMSNGVTELGYLNATIASSMGQTSTSNFIRNRLTSLTASSATPTSTTYDITLTGGSINISNNLTFLTPEVLGVVNRPIGHVTGTRSVTGTFSAYLDELTNSTVDLFQNIAEFGATTITNDFELNFYIGGGSGSLPTAPGVQIQMEQAHLEIPSINMDDVITTEVNFHALPSTVGGTNEITTVRYIGPAL